MFAATLLGQGKDLESEKLSRAETVDTSAVVVSAEALCW